MYISENANWPEEADVYAKIYVPCMVEKDGVLSNLKVIRSIEENFDKASIAVVKLMPKWKQGLKNGRIVRTQIVVPVKWVMK